jgi:hypothetical protein
MRKSTTSSIPANPVEARHVHEATSEVHEWLDTHGNELDGLDDDARLATRLRYVAGQLLAFDAQGQAEKSHENARELAALAIFYMARGLS